MARPRLINNNPYKEKETVRTAVYLDKETVFLWNKAKKNNVSLSGFLREQIRFHFGNNNTQGQNLLLMREMAALANRKRIDAEDEYRREMAYIEERFSDAFSTKENRTGEELKNVNRVGDYNDD